MSKTGVIRTRKRGKTWSYIFEAGRNEDNKRKVVEKGGFQTKEAAYEAGVVAYMDWKHGNIGITSERITVREFMEAWLTKVCSLNVRPSTLANYSTMTNYHIIPKLGPLMVQDISPVILDNWIRELTGKGLAFKSLKLIHAIFSHALDYAVYPGQLISNNPARYINIPKSAPKNIIERKIIDPGQFQELMEDFPLGHPMHIPALLLYYTGMRVGEVSGLTWENVDFRRRIININQQIRYIRTEKKHFLTAPKSVAGYRKIPVSDILIDELKNWKTLQEKNSFQLNRSYVLTYRMPDSSIQRMSRMFPPSEGAVPVEFVCTLENGMLCMPDSIRHYLIAKGFNSHSFRHTHATLLIESGASPKGVASRLGHASTQLTEDLYAHNTEKLSFSTGHVFDTVMQTNFECRQNADK